MHAWMLITMICCVALCACGDSSDNPEATADALAEAVGEDLTDEQRATAAGQIEKAMAMPHPAPVTVDPCTLLPTEEAAAYLEVEETKTKVGTQDSPFSECRHKNTFDSIALSIAGGLDAAEFERWVKGNADLAGDMENLSAVSGLGEKAFKRKDFLFVYADGMTFSLKATVSNERDDQARIQAHLDIATELAEKVLARL